MREKPNSNSAAVSTLTQNTKVRFRQEVRVGRDRWIEISSPAKGFVRSKDLAPAASQVQRTSSSD